MDPVRRRAAIDRIYRPKPDRRLLWAFRDVGRIASGKDIATEPTATFDGKVWSVVLEGQEVARLSEFPTFGETLTAAASLARKVKSDANWRLVGAPVKGSEPPLPFDDEAFAAARAAQSAWAGSSSRAALHEATRALVAIATQMEDAMGLADDVPARAFALLAIDKAIGGAVTTTLEAMLATAFGYRTEAQQLAAALPTSDAVRQFARLDDGLLEASAKRRGAPAWTKYLYLRRLDEWKRYTSAAEFADAAFTNVAPLPILAVRSHDRSLANRNEVASRFPNAVVAATARAAGSSDIPSKVERGEMLVRFDRELAAVGRAEAGPFVDGALHQSYLRAMMYTAEELDAFIEIDAYASRPRARELLAKMQSSTSPHRASGCSIA